MSNEIETAIDALEREKLEYQAQIQTLDFTIANLKALVNGGAPELPKVRSFTGLGIADAAKRWLEEVGGPQKTRAIADALLARGMTTNSQNYTTTVYSVLAASKDFHRTKTGEWELVKK